MQDCQITYDDFYRNFSFKEPFLAQRLFEYLDVDKSGYLSIREFINGLEIVVNGTDQEKMEFLFNVFDVDGDGRLDYGELRMLLKCCLEDSPSLDIESAVDDLTTALFRNTDTDCSGDITLGELKEAFRKHDSLFRTLTISTSVWIKPKMITHKNKTIWHKRFKEKMRNKRVVILFWFVYALINLATAVTAYFNYKDQPPLVIIARMCGNSLNFNCALVLGLVLRKHFTWLRTKGAGSFLPLDDYIELHKAVGIVILVETIVHTIAHLINLYEKCKKNNLNYWVDLFTIRASLGFPTGVLELFLLLIILLFTLSCVRKRGHFQLFYLFHLLSIPFLLIMLFHGKQFWKWLLVPGLLYTIEKILKFKKIRSNKFGDTFISEATLLPSKVTHLVIKRPKKFHYKAGDYIFINIPAIAKYEWHPFSISSVPELEESIWLHVRAVGNWTSKLNSFVRERLETKFSDETMLRTSMRSRMSRILSDVSEQHIKKVSWNMLNSNDRIRNENNSNRNIIDLMKNQTAAENDNINNYRSTVTVRKGILKTLSRDSYKSINETPNSSNNFDDMPIESTPKDGLKASFNKQQDDNKLKNNNNNEDIKLAINNSNINLNEISKMNSEELERLMQKLIDNKRNTVEVNADKNKLYDKKTINDAISITIDVDPEENKQHKLMNATNIQIESDNTEISFKKTLTHEESDDILGYLKMYKKTNRLCIQQMPSEERWSLKVNIDGPYQTTSQDIFDSEHVVLIAAGIGITPYASILQSIMQRFKKTKNLCPNCNYGWELEPVNNSSYRDSKIKKVDFIWVTRDQRSLEWFISMLSQMEIDQKKNNQSFLESHLYVTSARRQTDLKSIGLHMTLDVLYSEEDSRLIDGLKKRTHCGRPNWDKVFQSLIRKQEGKISVFFCGPPSLSEVLQEKCLTYNLAFKKELF